MSVRSHEIHLRIDFPLLLNWRCLYGPVVEVGVDRGAFSDMFLSRWYGNDFYGVDDYNIYPGISGSRQPDMLAAAVIYARHPTRARLLHTDSRQAAGILYRDLGPTFDMVYIDSLHTYEAVLGDIADWWPLISPRGILAGHDYSIEFHPSVVQAVDDFAEGGNHTVYVTDEALPSWYIYKSGLPTDEDTARRLKHAV